MRYTLFLFALLPFAFLSCKDVNFHNTYNVENPIEDLSWLKARIQESEQTRGFEVGDIYISQVQYNGNTIFIFGNCCEFCNTVISVFYCNGDIIGRLGCDVENEFVYNFNILAQAKIIWMPPNFICTDSNVFRCK